MDEGGRQTPVADQETEEGATLEIVTAEPETPVAVAVWLGMRLEFPSGRSLSLLLCSREQNGYALLVESVRGPSDEEENMVECSHCKTRHYVVSLADAIGEELLDLTEATVGIAISDIVARRLRDLEAVVASRS